MSFGLQKIRKCAVVAAAAVIVVVLIVVACHTESVMLYCVVMVLWGCSTHAARAGFWCQETNFQMIYPQLSLDVTDDTDCVSFICWGLEKSVSNILYNPLTRLGKDFIWIVKKLSLKLLTEVKSEIIWKHWQKQKKTLHGQTLIGVSNNSCNYNWLV